MERVLRRAEVGAEKLPGATGEDRRFVLLAGFALLAWLGMFVHNAVDLPSLTPLSLENSVPALVSTALVGAWRLLPWKLPVEFVLLAWGLLHLIGGGLLSVMPLWIWPFVPAQTLTHYAMHLLYGVTQLPLLLLLSLWIRSDRLVKAAR